jgi:hypothetical protein
MNQPDAARPARPDIAATHDLGSANSE